MFNGIFKSNFMKIGQQLYFTGYKY